ncbi:MAG: toll/interleukin-1 receptor domain-containing protein, partial [Clostridia bacterium]|nr:toll/interleukin-1 receptor domain-containing protein [Clostridia bacterium]
MKSDSSRNKNMQKCDVFISYRRDGGDMAAMYFYQALRERGYSVFYDLEILRSGKFNDALLTSIQSCRDFVLILSPHALDRCQEEDDWVRLEIAEALRLKKNIVPIMMKGFAFPDVLPPEIDDIRYQNGLSSTTEYFVESVNRLCSRYLLSEPKKAKKKAPVIPFVLAACLVCVLALCAYLLGSGQLSLSGIQRPGVQPSAEPVQPVAAADPAVPETLQMQTEIPMPVNTVQQGQTSVQNVNAAWPILNPAVENFVGENDTEWPVMLNTSLRRDQIRFIAFLPSLEGVPEDAWDISTDESRRIMAWTVPAGSLYDLYIAGDGGIRIMDAAGAS